MTDDTNPRDQIPRRQFLEGRRRCRHRGRCRADAGRGQPARRRNPRRRAAPPAHAAPEVWLTLTPTEAAFISAAADTLIPADELSPSGSDCGVATFIDRQLAGAFGNGARLYRQGPFPKAKPELGYQLALTPREFFRAGIDAANEWTQQDLRQGFRPPVRKRPRAAMKAHGRGQGEVPGLHQHDVLQRSCCRSRMEGFFADPMYGGNRNMAGWKMVGYPGSAGDLSRRDQDLFRQEIRRSRRNPIADFS